MSTQAPPCVSKRTTPEIDRAIGRGLSEKTFSASQCVASVKGGIFHRGVYGQARMPPPLAKIDHKALFDLGNLSMPLGAGLAALVLVGKHRLELSTTVASVLKEFALAPYNRITVDMLLDHTSGLPADAPLYETVRKADRAVHRNEQVAGTRKAQASMRQALLTVPTEASPGTRTCLSNLGFMLLGWMIEEMTGKSLDVFLNSEVFKPLGIDAELRYLPLGQRRDAKVPVAATLQCPWRNKLLMGEVSDANAWIQGGVAGHAGLFGTASAVWRLSQRLLECYHGVHSFFHTGTVSRFWTRSRRVQSTRTLAWDTPTVLDSSAGKRLARTSVGHVSGTGASLWIDPSSDVVGVYLSNASHPSPEGKAEAIFKSDARVFELIAAEAALGPPPPDADEAWERLVAQQKG